MTDRNPDATTSQDEQSTPGGASQESLVPTTPSGQELAPDEAVVPRQLGASRYVLAAFFAAGMTVTFIVSKVLAGAWNSLANNAWLSQHIPALSRIAEDDRPTFTMLIGAVVGVWVTFWSYRREDIRSWTNDVAAELAKVTWPSKKEVTNSTIVVVVTSAFATVFLALLDRFWNFVTNLVYGS